MIPNCNCMELKGYIKRCSMFIGARTHSTIAAYSSCVPTLVVGYSVKSRGIAKDLFGTYDNYVISVHSLKNEDDLLKGFLWLDKNKDKIKKHLEEIMPNYVKRCYEVKEAINEVRENAIPKKILPTRSNCTGCGACANICPLGCIKMVEDEKGFKYPHIDYTKCTRCNKCKNICPVLREEVSVRPISAYATYAKDEKIRMSSSSGGLFTVIAENILKSKGLVVGATLNGHNVEHIMIDSIKDLEKLKRSKYVQSDTKNIYKKIKEKLDKDSKVLFVGTACQVAGLKAYLIKDYVNLITIDVVCHGVPSPKVFDEYLKSIEKNNNVRITSVNFRSKVNGWNPFNLDIEGNNQLILSETISKNVFMKAFLQNLILRPSCYDCKFKNFKCPSDITLGDYWGIEYVFKNDEKLLDNKGVSLIMINTIKGKKILEEIKKQIYFKESNEDDMCRWNTAITTSVKKPSKYDEFWKNIDYEKIGDQLDAYTKE